MKNKKNHLGWIFRAGVFFSAALFICLQSFAQEKIKTDFNMPFFQEPVILSKNSLPEINASLTYPKREMRAAWIATVSNIDYPSATGLSVASLKSEFIAMIDKLHNAGINAVLFQVRPSCDAFYNSPYEPWSAWLSGTQGVAPAGGFDPLAFVIDETHKRGMELHAWVNPYRAVTGTSASIANSHISKTQPSWCVSYPSGTTTIKLLNPGLPQVRTYVTKVIADIVRRYKVDGIHFDDYFYPYPVSGTAFNDAAAFSADPRGISNLGDWRRDNVNIFVKMVNDSIKSIKPYVKFGIGPFGIWKSGVPSGVTGLSSYSDIYCDPMPWLANGSVDYIAPQLYWKIGTNQDFNTLVDWWGTQAHNKNRHCYAGLASYNLDASGANWAINDILNQIKNTRAVNSKAQGDIYFSAASISKNMKKFADSLTLSQDKYKCLIPTMPWLDNVKPLPPSNVTYTSTGSSVTLNWQKPAAASDGDTAKYFVIYRSTTGIQADTSNSKQILFISPTPIITYTDNITVSSYPGVSYAITSCDKLHNESAVVYVNINATPPACGTPSGLSAASITATSTTLNWSAVSGATSYNVQYKPTASGTWTSTTSSTTSKVIAALTPSTPYEFQVQAVCSSTGSFSASSNFSTTAAPLTNDNCSGAIVLTPGTTCVSTAGTIAGATASGVAKATCDVGTSTMTDVWYKFTATATTHTITLTPSSGLDGVVALYTSCTSGQIGCSDNGGGPGGVEKIVASTLTAGNTYYLRVYNYGSTAPTSSTFNICVAGVTAGPSCGTVTGLTTTSITSTGATLNWTAVSGAISYNIQYRASGSLTWKTVTSTTNSKAIISLSAVTTYQFQVQAVCSVNGVYSSIGTFITVGASNDNCANAQVLPINTSCVNTAGTLANSTPSGLAKGTCDVGSSTMADVWYSFVATATTHTITLTPSSGLDGVLVLYSSCNGTEMGCSDNNSGKGAVEKINATGLTIGNTYYLRIYSYGSSAPTTLTFNICVTKKATLVFKENGLALAEEHDPANTSALLIYPNPSDGTVLYGRIDNAGSDVQTMNVKMYDLFGREVFSKAVNIENEEFSISLTDAHLTSGMYMMVGVMNDQQYSQRVIVK